MAKKIILWIAVICMSLIIFGFSSETADESAGLSIKITNIVLKIVDSIADVDDAQIEEIFDRMYIFVRKGAHFTEFAILGVLTFFLAKSYRLSVWICILAALAYCLLFAIGDEVHQLFVDGRVGSAKDVFIDFCGSLSGVLVCALGTKIKIVKKRNINKLFISA